MKKRLLVLLVCFFVFALVGCSGTQEGTDSGGTKSSKNQNINIATGTTSGVYYPLGNAIAQMWSKKVTGVTSAAQSTSASVQNLNLLQQKETEVAFTMNSLAFYAYDGKDKFVGRPNKNLRAMVQLYPNVIQFVVRADSGINSIKDLKGKKFVPGAIGSGTEANSREIFTVYGLNYWEKGKENLKGDYVGFTEAVELMKNNQVDAALISAGVPNSALMDVANSIDIKVLPLEPEMIKEVMKQYPAFFEYTIPAGTYKGQDQDIKTLAQANLLVTRADLSDEVVYNLTKAIFDNVEDLIASHSIAKLISKEAALKGIGNLPVHPGALKYYKEIGVVK